VCQPTPSQSPPSEEGLHEKFPASDSAPITHCDPPPGEVNSGLNVVFRSVKGRRFAERKVTKRSTSIRSIPTFSIRKPPHCSLIQHARPKRLCRQFHAPMLLSQLYSPPTLTRIRPDDRHNSYNSFTIATQHLALVPSSTGSLRQQIRGWRQRYLLIFIHPIHQIRGSLRFFTSVPSATSGVSGKSVRSFQLKGTGHVNCSFCMEPTGRATERSVVRSPRRRRCQP